jgi:hypothetical protein
MGEVTDQLLMRVGLEKVGGAWQGAVFKHSWGFPSGPNRLLMAKDGSIIVGSAGGNGGWTQSNQYWDLQRLVPTGKVPFEMLMIRSKGPSAMEIEFTQPVAPASVAPANFALSQWNYTPTSAYGGPKTNTSTPTVSAAALSADGKKVTLTVSGMKEGYVLGFTLKNMKSAAGESIWSNVGYYTQNKFGPGVDHTYDSAGVTGMAPAPEALARDWSVRMAAPGRLDVRAPGSGSYVLSLADGRGRLLARCSGAAGSAGSCSTGAGMIKGIVFWEGRSSAGVARGKLAAP